MKVKLFHRRKKRRKTKQKGLLQRIGTLNVILVCVFAYMILFNQQMITLYERCGSAPESAWCALIAALIGECGICGWIKTSKLRSNQTQAPDETGPPKEAKGDPEETGNEMED